jgi:hypothetical protein
VKGLAPAPVDYRKPTVAPASRFRQDSLACLTLALAILAGF